MCNCIYFLYLCHFSGELTLEEFISGAREHPDIMDMLTKMMDLTHVLEIIVKGQQPKTKAVKWISNQQAGFWGNSRSFFVDFFKRMQQSCGKSVCAWWRAIFYFWWHIMNSKKLTQQSQVLPLSLLPTGSGEPALLPLLVLSRLFYSGHSVLLRFNTCDRWGCVFRETEWGEAHLLKVPIMVWVDGSKQCR